MLRAKRYDNEVDRLLKEYPEELANMAGDLMLAGLADKIDFAMTLRINDRFEELTGDGGEHIGAVKEAIEKKIEWAREAAKEAM